MTVSTTFRVAAYGQYTDELPLILITISHDDLVDDLYFASNTEDIVSRGNTYIGCPVEINLPLDSGEEVSKVSLTIDNVSRVIIDTIREIVAAPTVTLELILASDPDTIEAGPYNFTLIDVNYNQLVVTGTLGFEDILNQSYPKDSFTPADFPGIF